ncbi:hypothetical protein [Thalassobacillus pellis]|uniref:hypothetical protein n=1 Tax=Thalassobacillus pellis TaxID=748008 RepID=UPI0019610CB4|nr:hypothetical protein [Thalassobacillus pellis]MBM7552904.1 hypothetical protein [Thalassobacillus pellis]
MHSLQDAVYNWLTIKVVADNRPDDRSAVDTTAFFYEMLQEDHGVEKAVVNRDEEMYTVTCHKADEVRTFRFPSELIDIMHNQIKKEPHKFRNYT